jgi:hypothetical protein
VPPGNAPRLTIPPPLVQRNARVPNGVPPFPTTTDPSALTAYAHDPYPADAPGIVPSPTIPAPLVHRNADQFPPDISLSPTIAEPSALTA